MFCAKFGWNWPSVTGEEEENVRSLRQEGRGQRNGQCTNSNHTSSLESSDQES